MIVPHKITADESKKFEHQEMDCWGEYYRNVPPAIAKKFGISLERIGGAKATIASKVDMLAFNRVVGLGFETSITAGLLDDIIALYKEAGVKRFFIQLSPHAKAGISSDVLADKGFQYHNNWVKLYRPVIPIPVANTSLRIEVIRGEHMEAFSKIIVESFGWSDELRPILELPVGREGWRHYLAYDGDKPVACAAAFFRDEYASLAFAATLPEYRGLGAQSALIARRFQDASDACCKWMISETAEDRPDKPSASFRNMIRHGFRTAYLRQNYIYHCAE